MSEYVTSEFKRLGVDYVVSYDSISKTNQEDLLHHSHKEADTLLIMHCWEIARRNPFDQSIVYFSGTEGFLYLIFHYLSLPNALIFGTSKRSNLRSVFIGTCYKALGSCRANALPDFHTFTGCNQVRRFMENPKRSCAKTL